MTEEEIEQSQQVIAVFLKQTTARSSSIYKSRTSLSIDIEQDYWFNSVTHLIQIF